jgi:hypothetical protein
MFKKIFAMCLIAIICIGTLSAARINIDADWRLVHNFKITDQTNNVIIWDRDVAASDSHSKTFDSNPHKLHQISITVVPYGLTNPSSITKIVNVYLGGDMDIYASLKFRWFKPYDSTLSRCIVDGKNI